PAPGRRTVAPPAMRAGAAAPPPVRHPAPSSSPVQDARFSSWKPGFESPWGHCSTPPPRPAGAVVVLSWAPSETGRPRDDVSLAAMGFFYGQRARPLAVRPKVEPSQTPPDGRFDDG